MQGDETPAGRASRAAGVYLIALGYKLLGGSRPSPVFPAFSSG